MKRIIYFLGKGGVGKTTSSACLSYYLSYKKNSVYWFSIDPAHNIFDVVGYDGVKNNKKIINEYLVAEEIDVDFYLNKFISETSKKMKDLYKYLQIINLEHMFDVMKYSPGMEESAIMYAMKEKIEEYQDKDYIIVDTPPTGLMLKIFALPFTSNVWIEKLIKLRKQIISRRAAIANIDKKRFDSDVALSEHDDKALEELTLQHKTVKFIIDIMQDRDKTKTVVVLNEDLLSINEAKKIVKGLNSMKIFINLVLVNKKGLMKDAVDTSLIFRDKDKGYMPFVETKEQDLRKMAEQWAYKII